MKKISVPAFVASRVSFSRNGFASLALLLGAACGGLTIASADSLPLAFENLSGNSSSQVWIQFLGGDQVTGTYVDSLTGQTNQLQANTAYSLDQLVNPTTGPLDRQPHQLLRSRLRELRSLRPPGHGRSRQLLHSRRQPHDRSQLQHALPVHGADRAAPVRQQRHCLGRPVLHRLHRHVALDVGSLHVEQQP